MTLTPMRLAATLASLAVLAGYLVLMTRYPEFTLTSPRGGIVVLGISLLIANTGIWLAGRQEVSANMRFQMAAAGWIWILVQGGAQVYLYRVAG